MIQRTGAKAYSHSLIELFDAPSSVGLKAPDNVVDRAKLSAVTTLRQVTSMLD